MRPMKNGQMKHQVGEQSLQNSGAHPPQDASNHSGAFLKTSQNNGCTNGKCGALPVLVLHETTRSVFTSIAEGQRAGLERRVTQGA